MSKKNGVNLLEQWFLTGLMFIVPLVVTFFVLWKMFLFFDGILGPVLNRFVFERYLGMHLPGVGIALLLVVILIAGMVGSFAAGRFSKVFEQFFLGLPVVSNIYGPMKKMASFLFAKEKPAFRKVVLVEYPSKGLYAVGFLTGENHTKICSAAGKDLVSVLISHSPSPISGFTALIPREDIVELDMSIEEAMQFILSAGMLGE